MTTEERLELAWREVRHAEDVLAKRRAELGVEIREAQSRGMTLRAIAAVVRLSVGRVHQILQE